MMSATVETVRGGRIRGTIRRALDDPLRRNAYGLLAGSLLASALGVAYWALSARLYPTHVVGTGAALFAAVTFVSGPAQLGLTGVLMRYLPVAGPKARRLLLTAYLAAATTAGAAALVAGLVLGHVSPTLAFLDEPAWLAGFALVSMAWTLIALEEAALAGMRRSRWVVLETLGFSLGRIAGLLALAWNATTAALFTSWSLPAIAVIGAMTWLIFRRLLPSHVSVHAEATLPQRSVLVSSTLANSLGTLFGFAVLAVPPIVVADTRGTTEAAYFAIPWAVVTALMLISSAFSTSLTVEGAFDPQRLRGYVRAAAGHAARLQVPAVAIVLAGAPLLLKVFGDSYSREGASLLRLVAIASLPVIVINIAISVARVREAYRTMIGLPLLMCLLTLAPMQPVLERWGLEGVGVVWIAAQSLTALVAFAWLWHAWHRRERTAG